MLNVPVNIQIISLRPGSTALTQPLQWRAIDRECEEILRLRIVGYKAGGQKEVDEAKHVSGEDRAEDDVENALSSSNET